MYRIIIRELLLEQLHNKKQLLIKCILIIATLGMGFFFIFPYLYLLPLMAIESAKHSEAKETGDSYRLPHIQYMLPITRAMLKRNFLIRAGIVALFYSMVCVLGYVSCYIGNVYCHVGHYEIVEMPQYCLYVFVVALGFFLYAFGGRINRYARECQVQGDTVTPVFMRMGRLTKAMGFFGGMVIAVTMAVCAGNMMVHLFLPEAAPGGCYAALWSIAILGYLAWSFVVYRNTKQLLVADYQ